MHKKKLIKYKISKYVFISRHKLQMFAKVRENFNNQETLKNNSFEVDDPWKHRKQCSNKMHSLCNLNNCIFKVLISKFFIKMSFMITFTFLLFEQFILFL